VQKRFLFLRCGARASWANQSQGAPAPQITTTLDAAAWIEAAFDALSEGGIEAVRVDPLAKRLGVTRGSFYWHFKDRDALHKAMLKQWRKAATYQVGDRIEREVVSAGDRLRRTLALPNSSPRAVRAAGIEIAIRIWARRDADAAQAVQMIDHQRLGYYAKLFEERGCTPDEARQRAYIFYAALMSQATIITDEQTDVRRDLAKLVIGDEP
jgi:AcrR family transcriptional regulator